MKKVLEILLYIWQIPQNIVGLFVRFIMGADQKTVKGYRGDTTVFSSSKMSGGISLGKYIMLDKTYGNYDRYKETWDHEYGHTRQSRILGPLYLFVIGIPSIIWAGLYGPVIKPTYNGYYKFYTEKWADKLGGIIRK